MIKGLSEAVTRFIIRKFPSRLEISEVTVLTPEMQLLYDTSNCAQRIKYAHRKNKEGLTIAEISFFPNSTVKTINRYLSISENEIPEDRKISRERQHQLAIEQKQKEVDETRELYKQGYSIEYIGKYIILLAMLGTVEVLHHCVCSSKRNVLMLRVNVRIQKIKRNIYNVEVFASLYIKN